MLFLVAVSITVGQHDFPSWAVCSRHYGDVIMGVIASQITSLTIVYSAVYSGADQRKHQSSASLAFVRGIHRGPVNSPHKWLVTRKMFPFDDVIMTVVKFNNRFVYQIRSSNWNTGFTLGTMIISTLLRVGIGHDGPSLPWAVLTLSLIHLTDWLGPSDAFTLHSTRSRFVQIMVCRLLGTNLLSEPMLACY